MHVARSVVEQRGALTLVERTAQGLLVALALLLPFEAPLFRVGPIGVTTVELVMYVLLGVHGFRVAGDWMLEKGALPCAVTDARADPLALAALAWITVVFASALGAGADRGACLKFALRTLCGVLVFFAARSLARFEVVARRVLVAILAGALVSAGSALVETWVPSSEPLFGSFREGGFDAFGLPRASGVFGYPTIGAMYWEAAVPLMVVASFRGPASPERRPVRLALVGTTVLFAAILASATRSAVAGAAVVIACLWAFTRSWYGDLPRTALGALLLLAATSALSIALPGAGALLGQRLRWWQDDHWFGVEYRVASRTDSVADGELFATKVQLRNTGTLTWRSSGRQPTRLSNHWYADVDAGPPRALLTYDGRRTALPEDVPPGGVVDVVAVARAPEADGTYRLTWDLVQEGVTWFSERGNPTGDERVVVRGHSAGDRAPLTVMPLPVTPPPSPGRPALWRAAIALFVDNPGLGVGPDNFRRRYEAIVPPGPKGERYVDTRIHANNLYLETLADLGLLGAAALLALVRAWLRVLRDRLAARQALGVGFALAAGAFFVHGAFDYFLEFTPAYGLFWMLLGLLAAGRGDDVPRAPRDTPA